MSEDQGIRFPGGGAGTSSDGAGFAAVRAKYGPDMVVRIQNWPRIAEAYCWAQNGDQVMVDKDVAKATADMNRARNDRDFALAQADSIARKVDRDRWTIVPSVAQLRRQWLMDEPIGTVHLTPLPRTKFPSTLPKPPIQVDEADVAARRKAAAERAARLRIVMGPHAQ